MLFKSMVGGGMTDFNLAWKITSPTLFMRACPDEMRNRSIARLEFHKYKTPSS